MRIVEFCRFARKRGLPCGVQETLGALETTTILGLENSDELKFGLQSILCSSKDDCDLFEECFREFWGGSQAGLLPKAGSNSPREEKTIIDRSTPQSLISGGSGKDSSLEEAGSQAAAGASARERLTTVDFSTVPPTDATMLEQIALRLFKQLSKRLARRRRNGVRGQVDLRKTLRRNISRGGDPISLRYRERKRRPYRLVMLLDISGSMSPYSIFLLKFVYALQKHFQRVDSFLFSTRLVEVSSQFRGHHLSDALQALSQQPAGWAGGTQIGGSLREFNRLHRRKLRPSETLFIILSDGWETGDSAVLAEELGAVKQRVHKLIWMNPLLGMKDYQPITRGMSAALPYIDVFAPAHNVESLLSLEQHL